MEQSSDPHPIPQGGAGGAETPEGLVLAAGGAVAPVGSSVVAGGAVAPDPDPARLNVVAGGAVAPDPDPAPLNVVIGGAVAPVGPVVRSEEAVRSTTAPTVTNQGAPQAAATAETKVVAAETKVVVAATTGTTRTSTTLTMCSVARTSTNRHSHSKRPAIPVATVPATTGVQSAETPPSAVTGPAVPTGPSLTSPQKRRRSFNSYERRS